MASSSSCHDDFIVGYCHCFAVGSCGGVTQGHLCFCMIMLAFASDANQQASFTSSTTRLFYLRMILRSCARRLSVARAVTACIVVDDRMTATKMMSQSSRCGSQRKSRASAGVLAVFKEGLLEIFSTINVELLYKRILALDMVCFERVYA